MVLTVYLKDRPPKAFDTRAEADRYVIREFRKEAKLKNLCSFAEASERARRNGPIEYALAQLNGFYERS